MKTLLGVLLLGLLAWSLVLERQAKDDGRSRKASVEVRVAHAKASDGPGDDLTAASTAATEHVVPDDPFELIEQVADTYGVPAGALYGIWQAETAGLKSGWGKGRAWFRAYRLSYKNSVCVKEYGPDMCWRNWLALRSICEQRRTDGTQVCDPFKVRTAYALEMGPMQFLPTTLVKGAAEGKPQWSEYAVDYDRDGVIDPHSLPDAMASAAVYLRTYYEKKAGKVSETAAWRYAVIRYNGASEYYSGVGKKIGVAGYWKRWCKKRGCQSDRKKDDRLMADAR